MTADADLVLIEPYAHRTGGHHHHAMVVLARSRPGSLIIAPHGIPDELAALLTDQTRVVTGGIGTTSAVLLTAAKAAVLASAVGQRACASRRWPTCVRSTPHQITLIARCLTEAACLRTARRLTGGRAGAIVVLSASEALHGTAALLGGLPHLRFVHEAVTTEDLPLRLLARLTRHSETKVLALYPTAAIRAQFTSRAFPRLAAAVRTFAVDDGARLGEPERRGARAAFSIPRGERAVCLVGGWWPYKDITVIDAALDRLRHPLHLLVTGTPLDGAMLARWRSLPQVRLHTMPGAASEQVLRIVYAAADAALVARHRGVGKESGLVMDTARLGVPLIVSDHDPDLTARLHGQVWVRLFPAGDAYSLANVLDRLAYEPPERPGPDAPRLLGMLPADEQAAFLTDAYTQLLAESIDHA